MSQPRPVVTTSRILGALAILLGLVPTALMMFGIEWSADTLVAYAAVSGGVITALSILFGVQVEKRVTPVGSPRDDAGVPFVPIALDSYED